VPPTPPPPVPPPPVPPTPPTPPLIKLQNITHKYSSNILAKCNNNYDCNSYNLYSEDLCNNFFTVHDFYNLNEVSKEQQNWQIYCDKYDKNSECYNKCRSYIIKNNNYCCNNECSSVPCHNINYKWCLYKAHIFGNIHYTKQILEIDASSECPNHPFGLSVAYVSNIEEAYNWINSNDF
jgi:hypothetical protein